MSAFGARPDFRWSDTTSEFDPKQTSCRSIGVAFTVIFSPFGAVTGHYSHPLLAFALRQSRRFLFEASLRCAQLAAIVAADVAGYSRLMGLDEVGTARALREHRMVTD